MRIDLDDSWAIELEVGCATLIEVGVIKDNPNSRFRPKPEDIGKKRDGRPRYYGGLGDALIGYATHGFGSMKPDALPATELELLLRRQDEIIARIEQVLSNPPTKKDIECSSPAKGTTVHLVHGTKIHELYRAVTGNDEALVGTSTVCGYDKDGNVIDAMHVPLRDPKFPNLTGCRIVMREHIAECVEADRADATAALAR